MCSDPGGLLRGADLLFLTFGVGLNVVMAGSMYETLGVDS